MKASDLFVKCLEQEGVEYIFGVPGEENLDLLNSLAGSSIRFVLTRHEQAAGFMAATFGRLTGRPGVCLSTLGPGATNLMTAAAFAHLGAMPMVMITGQKPIRSSEQGQFQRLDIVAMMTPVSRMAQRIESADLIPASVREAFRRALQPRSGPVHLELPEDIAQETTDQGPLPVVDAPAAVAEPNAIRQAAKAIRESSRPLLLIGAAANRCSVPESLQRFVQTTGLRFLTTQMGKGAVPEDHPAFIGNATLSSGDFVHRAIEHADVIVNVGHDVVEKPPFVMRNDRNGPTVIHVNAWPARIDPVYCPQLEVIGDIAHTMDGLTEQLGETRSFDSSFFDKVRSALRSHIERAAQDDRFPMRPERLVSELNALLHRDDIVTLDNGIYKLWFARNFQAGRPDSVLLDNALASMGAGLPAAISAAITCPDRQVVAVCGDGGFMMNSAEVETAVRLQLDLVILILTDDTLGMIRWKQQHQDFQDYGLRFGNPDFLKYADAYGATGHSLKSLPELAETIREAWRTGGVHLIEVPVDYSENDRVLNHEVQALSSQL